MIHDQGVESRSGKVALLVESNLPSMGQTLPDRVQVYFVESAKNQPSQRAPKAGFLRAPQNPAQLSRDI